MSSSPTRVVVRVTDPEAARRHARHVRLGQHFAYATRDLTSGGQRERLGLVTGSGRSVLPVVDTVRLPGIELRPGPAVAPLGALVADRDLVRAEVDSAHLFAAVPSRPHDLQLHVHVDGAPLLERPVVLDPAGVAVERLSALLPGGYRAWLAAGGHTLGEPVSFTVAEYALAPLSARLLAHELDRSAGELRFTLAVESYQVPFARALDVALVEDGREHAHAGLEPDADGLYSGSLPLRGAGPFRLRLTARDDPGRIAEVALPGMREAERELTVVSELGQEVRFSLAPEADAIAARGGWLSRGDRHAVPLTVDDVVTDLGRIAVHAPVESLALVVVDLVNGSVRAIPRGDVEAGTTLTVELHSALSTVFVGGFVGERPFEGYTTFFRREALDLALEVPLAARPGGTLPVRLRVGGAAAASVLLSVRDERLTATETPALALAGSLKRAIARATDGMQADEPFVELAEMTRRPMGSVYGAPPPGAMLTGTIGARLPDQSINVAARSTSAPPPTATHELLFGLAPPALAAAVSAAPAPPAAPPLATRSSFPEVLFYDIVRVDGERTVEVALGDATATLAVEALAIAGDDWKAAAATVGVDRPVRVDLELPPFIHPDDRVLGRVRVGLPGDGRGRLELTRDGQPVALLAPADGAGDGRIASGEVREFTAAPGIFVASLVDAESGERDRIERRVETPGRFRTLGRELAVLSPGERLRLDGDGVLSLRILPGLGEPFGRLVTATAGYEHLCCEQTAAKMLAAAFLFLTAGEAEERSFAEGVLRSGVDRLEGMWIKRRGFAMYPGRDVNEHLSRLAARYLRSLVPLQTLPRVTPSVVAVARRAAAMAREVAESHGMPPVPAAIQSAEDAYALAVASPADRLKEALDWFVDHIDLAGDEPRPRRPGGAVQDRVLLAYAAASLIAGGNLSAGLRAANRVTRALNEQGRLYSTTDSVAAIALLMELRRAGILASPARLRVNGVERSTADAAALADGVEEVEVLDGRALVETTRLVEEDWSRFAAAMPLKFGFRDARDRSVERFRAGDRADLVVSLPRGYQVGDLVHVMLPASLSWIHGGAQVKRFAVDFAGQDEVRVPLAVTSRILERERFALCVRNMYEEERVATPGPVAVTAA